MRGEGIKKVNTLLEKYTKNIKAPQRSVESAFIKAVFTTLGITLKKEQVRYSVSSRTLSVSVTGPLKSEILFHKAALFKACSALLGEKNAPHHIV